MSAKKTTKGFRVHRLRITDFLGIESLDLRPGHITHISGGNGAGKSSIEKAMAALLGDRGELPEKAIRHGADEATIYLDLGELKATRKWQVSKKNGEVETSVSVKDQGGAPVAGGAEVLRRIANLNAISPLRMMREHPQKQMEAVLGAVDTAVTPEFMAQLLGDVFWASREAEFVHYLKGRSATEAIEKVREALFAERTVAGRLKEAKGQAYEEISREIPAGFKIEENATTATELVAKLNEARDYNRRRAAALDEAQAAKKSVADCDGEILRCEAEIKRLQERIADVGDQRERAQERFSAIAAEWSEAGNAKPAIDTSGMEKLLADLERDRALAGKLEMRERLEAEFESAAGEWEVLEEACVAVRDRAFPALIASNPELSKFAINIVDGKMTVRNVPIEQLSTGESLHFWLTLATKRAGDLPVVFLDGAEQLDSEHMAIIEQYAQEHPEVQWFIAEVGEGELAVRTEGMVEERPALTVVNGAGASLQAEAVAAEDDIFKGVG